MNGKKILVYASSLLLAVSGGAFALSTVGANNDQSNMNLTTAVAGNHDHVAVKKAAEVNAGEIVASDYISNAVVQSVETSEGIYDLRFVALVKADAIAEDGSGAALVGDFGFHIEFEGSTGSVEQDVVVSHYYNSISETVNGVTTYYTNELSSLKNEANRKDLSEMPNYAEGYNLVIALTVEDIPEANINTLFTAQPFVKVGESTKYVETKRTTVNAVTNDVELNFAIVNGEYSVLTENTELPWNADDVVSFVDQDGASIDDAFTVPYTGTYNVTTTNEGVAISTTADVAGVVVDNASVTYSATEQFVSVEVPEGVTAEAKYYVDSNEVNPLKVGTYDVVVSFVTDGTYSIEDYETTFEITAPEGGFNRIETLSSTELTDGTYALGFDDKNGTTYVIKNNFTNSSTIKLTSNPDYFAESPTEITDDTAWNIAKVTGGYTISADNGNVFSTTASSTSLPVSSNSTAETWILNVNDNGSYYFTSTSVGRAILYNGTNSNSAIGHYAVSNVGATGYGLLYLYSAGGVEQAKTLTITSEEDAPYVVTATSTNGSLEGLYSVDTVTITVTPNAGSNIVINSVSIGGKEYQLTNNNGVYTCTFNPTTSGEITVNYNNTYTVTYVYNDGVTADKVLDDRYITLPETLEEPTREGYNFGGWYTDEALTSKAVEGKELTENVTLYAKWNDASSTEPITETVSLTIADVATENNWVNGTAYNMDNVNDYVSITYGGTGNSGKYYSSDSSWRIYQSGGGTVTVSGKSDKVTINSVTFTFTNSNNGTLLYDGSVIDSGTALTDLNSNSLTFTTGNSGTKTNGQIRIKVIVITYTVSVA